MGTGYDLSLVITALAEMFSWMGSVVIIAGFFWIQVQVDQLGNGWVHTILFLLSIIPEVYLLWLWNSRDL